MKLEEFQVYQHSLELGERVWKMVRKWDSFARDTVGKQLIKAVDSVAANLSEGYGRYYYKENKQFCYYSRGSLYETKTWLIKAYHRRLMTEEHYDAFMNDIEIIGVKLNNYINSIGKQKPPNDTQ